MSELAACLAVFQRFAAATVPGRRIERYIFYSCTWTLPVCQAFNSC